MTHGARDETHVEIEVRQRTDRHDAEGAATPAPGAGRQPTGDDAVDEVLARLDAVADGPLDSQIEVGEQVHRVLKSRLADLGKE